MSTPPSEQRLLQVSILVTAVLAVAGIGFGVYSRSQSIISDGLFNAIDSRGEVANGLGFTRDRGWL